MIFWYAHLLNMGVGTASTIVAGPFLAPTGAVSVSGGTMSGAVWPLGAGSGAISDTQQSGEVVR